MTSTYTNRLDGVSVSVAVKAPVRVASTGNLTLSGLQSVDGVTVASGDRVLVKDQTDAVDNGIYQADTGTWDRALDFDGNRDLVDGTVVYVVAGTININTWWRVTTDNPIVVGTSEIAFTVALLGLSLTLYTPEQAGAEPIDLDGDPSSWFDSTSALNTWANYTGPKYAARERVYYAASTVEFQGKNYTHEGCLRVRTGAGQDEVAFNIRPTAYGTYTNIVSVAADGRSIVVDDASTFAAGMLVHLRSNQWFTLRTKPPIGEVRVCREIDVGADTVYLEAPVTHPYRSTAIAQITITGGADYAPGEILTLVGGTGTAARFIIGQVDAEGRPVDIGPYPDTDTGWGIYSVFPTGTISMTVDTGAGTGATCTIVACSCDAAAIDGVTVFGEFEIYGDPDGDDRTVGVNVDWPEAGTLKVAGQNLKSRVWQVRAGLGLDVEVGVVKDANGESFCYGGVVAGAARNIRVFNGYGKQLRHFFTTANPSNTDVRGISQDIDIYNGIVENTQTTSLTSATVTDVDPDADSISAALDTDNISVDVTISSTGDLPGGLAPATIYYASQFVENSFFLYPTKVDRITGENRVDITDPGSGTITLTHISKSDALDTHSGAINVRYIDCVVESATGSGVNMECCGGALINCKISNAGNQGVHLRNETFRPATWIVTGLEVTNSGEEEGQYGVVCSSSYYTHDEVFMSTVNVRNPASAGIYTNGRGAGRIILRQFDGIHVTGGELLTGAIWLRNTDAMCVLNFVIDDVPAGGKGLRIYNTVGIPGMCGTIVAAGNEAVLVSVEATTTGASTKNTFGDLRLNNDGYTDVVGINQDDTVTYSTINEGTIDFYDCAQPSTTLGSGVGNQLVRRLNTALGHGADNTGVRNSATAIVALFQKPGFVIIEPGIYNIDSGTNIELGDGTVVWGYGATLDFTEANDNDSRIGITGTAGSDNTLTGNVAAAANVLPLTNVTDLAYGDLLYLSDTSYGEYVVIESIASLNVTIHGVTEFAYTTARSAKVRKITPKNNCAILGLKIIGKGPLRELDFTSGGPTAIVDGNTITGATSAATAIVHEVVLDSGSWGAGNAVGTLTLRAQDGNFTAENLDIGASLNRATVAGDSVAIDSTEIGISARYARDFAVRDVRVDLCDYHAIRVNDCYGGEVDNCDVYHKDTDSALDIIQYGVSLIGATTKVVVQNTRVVGGRHGIVYTDQVGGGWSLHNKVQGCTVTACNKAAYATHAMVKHASYIGNDAIYCRRGYAIRVTHVSVIGGRILMENGLASEGEGVYLTDDVSDVTLTDLYIEGGRWSVKMDNAQLSSSAIPVNVEIIDCVVKNCDGDGLSLQHTENGDDKTGWRIRGNTIEGCAGEAMDIDGNFVGMVISDNVIRDVGGHCILLRGTAECVIRNNDGRLATANFMVRLQVDTQSAPATPTTTLIFGNTYFGSAVTILSEIAGTGTAARDNCVNGTWA